MSVTQPSGEPEALWIDTSAFPMVMDRLYAYADHSTLLALRATSRTMHKRVDNQQQHHIVLTTDEYPREGWIVAGRTAGEHPLTPTVPAVATYYTPNILVRYNATPDAQLHRIPALMEWHASIHHWNPDKYPDEGEFFPVSNSVWDSPEVLFIFAEDEVIHKPQPLIGARVVDILGHVPFEGLVQVLWVAPNLETTRYFPLAKGVCTIPTHTRHIVVDTYLVSPGGHERSNEFIYNARALHDTERVVNNIAYRMGSNLSNGKVDTTPLPSTVKEVVFVFNPIPEGNWKPFELEAAAKTKDMAAERKMSVAVSGNKMARGVLCDIVTHMATYFKSAHFEKRPFAIKFTFVGADLLGRAVLGLDEEDDILTEVCEGVEAALRDPDAIPRQLTDPRRALPRPTWPRSGKLRTLTSHSSLTRSTRSHQTLCALRWRPSTRCTCTSRKCGCMQCSRPKPCWYVIWCLSSPNPSPR